MARAIGWTGRRLWRVSFLMPRRAVDIMRQLSVAPLPAIAAACGGSAPRCSLHDAQERVLHFERWRIFLRFFCRRRVLFFFHFQRNIERAFLYGFDLYYTML